MRVEVGQVVFYQMTGTLRYQATKSGIDRLEMRILLSGERCTFPRK